MGDPVLDAEQIAEIRKRANAATPALLDALAAAERRADEAATERDTFRNRGDVLYRRFKEQFDAVVRLREALTLARPFVAGPERGRHVLIAIDAALAAGSAEPAPPFADKEIVALVEGVHSWRSVPLAVQGEAPAAACPTCGSTDPADVRWSCLFHPDAFHTGGSAEPAPEKCPRCNRTHIEYAQREQSNRRLPCADAFHSGGSGTAAPPLVHIVDEDGVEPYCDNAVDGDRMSSVRDDKITCEPCREIAANRWQS